jgi:hypothetical protein
VNSDSTTSQYPHTHTVHLTSIHRLAILLVALIFGLMILSPVLQVGSVVPLLVMPVAIGISRLILVVQYALGQLSS